MPHEWNNTWVVTVEELVPRWFNCIKTLQSNITRYKGKPYGIKKVQSGGMGRPMLIAFDSLSTEIQNGIGDPRNIGHLLEMFYRIDSDAVTFFTTHKVDNIVTLELKYQNEYITNASVLKACVALKAARVNERRTKNGSLKGVMSTICADVISFNKVLLAKHNVKHTLPHSEKRFKETFKAFLNDGGEAFNYKSLISAKIRNVNAQKVTDHLMAVLNQMFAMQTAKPTRTQIGRQYDAFMAGYVELINEDTGEIYDPKDFKPLSESTVFNYLSKWEERIGTYTLRSGDRQKLFSQFKPYHSLDKPTYAGSLISIDDRQPPFQYATGLRPWFYNAIDLASEAFTCWVYGKSKEGIITDFYRQLVRNYTEWGFNLPAELEAEMSLNASFIKTFLRPGAMFQHVRIEANNARGKRIEAYYRQLRYAVEKDRTGWLARPFSKSEANQAGNAPVPLVPYKDIIDGCLRDIEDWNNSPHSVHTNKTRWQVFKEMQNPDLKPTNWKAILPYLGYTTTTSCNKGIIHLENREFLLGDDGEVYTGDRLISLMKIVEGREFDIFWLDNNNGGVLKAVIMLDDTVICEAVPKPTYNRARIERTPTDEAARNVMSAYENTLTAYQRRKAASIDNIVVIDNTVKTLNRDFVIPGITRYEAKEDGAAVEILEPAPDEAEVLFTTPPKTFTKSLKDRF
jgi:hypothetical protein